MGGFFSHLFSYFVVQNGKLSLRWNANWTARRTCIHTKHMELCMLHKIFPEIFTSCCVVTLLFYLLHSNLLFVRRTDVRCHFIKCQIAKRLFNHCRFRQNMFQIKSHIQAPYTGIKHAISFNSSLVFLSLCSVSVSVAFSGSLEMS